MRGIGLRWGSANHSISLSLSLSLSRARARSLCIYMCLPFDALKVVGGKIKFGKCQEDGKFLSSGGWRLPGFMPIVCNKHARTHKCTRGHTQSSTHSCTHFNDANLQAEVEQKCFTHVKGSCFRQRENKKRKGVLLPLDSLKKYDCTAKAR